MDAHGLRHFGNTFTEIEIDGEATWENARAAIRAQKITITSPHLYALAA